jgi:hypothetical protein
MEAGIEIIPIKPLLKNGYWKTVLPFVRENISKDQRRENPLLSITEMELKS